MQVIFRTQSVPPTAVMGSGHRCHQNLFFSENLIRLFKAGFRCLAARTALMLLMLAGSMQASAASTVLMDTLGYTGYNTWIGVNVQRYQTFTIGTNDALIDTVQFVASTADFAPYGPPDYPPTVMVCDNNDLNNCSSFTTASFVSNGLNTVSGSFYARAGSVVRITISCSCTGQEGFGLVNGSGSSPGISSEANGFLFAMRAYGTLTPVGIVSFAQSGAKQILLGGTLSNPASSTLSGGGYGTISYRSSNTAVATVDSNGVITTVAAGAAIITATQAGVQGINTQTSANYQVSVLPLPLPVLSYSLSGAQSVTMGGSLTNTVSSTLSGGSYGAITYSSANTAIATVSAAGVVTPVAPGSTTITATQAMVSMVNAQVSASYTLTVNALPVPLLSFAQSGAQSVTLGGSLSNAVSSSLTGGSYGAISYSSSNTAVATVSAAGVVTPVAVGSATITATQAAVAGVNAQASQTYSLTVNALPVPLLNFAQSGAQSVNLGGSLSNSVSSSLTGGSYGAITYSSSNNAIATISASGVVTPVAVGSVTITATQAAVAGVNAQATLTYNLTVNALPVPSLSFAQSGAQSVNLGASLSNLASSSLTSASYGNITYSSSNSAIATVSAAGVVTPLALGSVNITATQAAVAGVNAQATVSYTLTVSPLPVPVLSFAQAGTQSVTLGASLSNAASTNLSGGSYGAITYSSSNPAVATVSASGVVTPVTPGVASIIATQAAVSGVNASSSVSYTLNVAAVPVLSFSRSGNLSIFQDGVLNNPVSSTLNGGSYGVISYSSSNPEVATVSSTGVVVPQSIGNATISATQAAVTGANTRATASYNLVIQPVMQPILSFAQPASQQLMTGSTLNNPASSTASGSNHGAITYSSSNTTVATVSGSGMVTALSAGFAIITANQAAVAGVNQSATTSYSISVQNTPVPVLSFARTGDQTASVGKAFSNPVSSSLSGSTYGAISYSSSNTQVATVDGNGQVMPLSVGAVVITANQAAVSGKQAQASASYNLNIVLGSQAVLILNADKTSLYKNTGRALLSTSGGSGGGAVTYLLSSGNCTLNANLVTAGSSAGTCLITATKAADGSYTEATASLSLQVLNQVAASLSLSLSSSQLMQGQTVELTATVTPATASGKVSFFDGGVNIGTAPLKNGAAVLSFVVAGVGAHNFSVSYEGDSEVAPAASNGTSVIVMQRPDPTISGAAGSIINAQVKSSQRFATAQLNNINSHLQQLHHQFGVRNDFGLTFNLPYLDQVRMVGNKILDNLALTQNGSANEFGQAAVMPAGGQLPVQRQLAPYSQGEAAHGQSLDSADRQAGGAKPQADPGLRLLGMPVGFWSSGSIEAGNTDGSGGSDASRIHFSSKGLSLGMDMLLRPDLIVGVGIGYGRDRSDFDSQGSGSQAHQWSGSVYASYQADTQWYIDGLLGYGSLHLDSSRWDASSTALLNGSRSGSNYYASLALTRVLKVGELQIHPFGRIDLMRLKLDSYSEAADSMALSYQAATSNSRALAGGLDVSREYLAGGGKLIPSLKFQFRHNLAGSLTQNLYYSELGAAAGVYHLVVSGLPENMASLGLGLAYVNRQGFRVNVSWLGSMGGNAYRSNSLRFDLGLGF